MSFDINKIPHINEIANNGSFNGARSKNAALSRVMKPLFYLYYPLHLFDIGLIRTFFLS